MALKGRGTTDNPPNRFEQIVVEADPEAAQEEAPSPKTRFFNDATRGVLSKNDRPGAPFKWGLNPYRGCEHGCIYCYARNYHEYLGFSAGLDFETKILVKREAPALLRKKFASRNWKPETVWMSGVTDPYQPVERSLKVVRGCLEVFADFRNPVAIITKNRLVTRDKDLLGTLAKDNASAVHMSITTLDPELHRLMEPRTSTPQDRFEAVRELTAEGIPVGVWISPVIPGLNDHEIPKLVAAAEKAGAHHVTFMPIRLPGGVRDLFKGWLKDHYPDRLSKVMNQIDALGPGDPEAESFTKRMLRQGAFYEQMRGLFRAALRKSSLQETGPELSTAAFRRPSGAQIELF